MDREMVIKLNIFKGGPFRSGVTASQALPSAAPEVESITREQQGVD